VKVIDAKRLDGILAKLEAANATPPVFVSTASTTTPLAEQLTNPEDDPMQTNLPTVDIDATKKKRKRKNNLSWNKEFDKKEKKSKRERKTKKLKYLKRKDQKEKDTIRKVLNGVLKKV